MCPYVLGLPMRGYYVHDIYDLVRRSDLPSRNDFSLWIANFPRGFPCLYVSVRYSTLHLMSRTSFLDSWTSGVWWLPLGSNIRQNKHSLHTYATNFTLDLSVAKFVSRPDLRAAWRCWRELEASSLVCNQRLELGKCLTWFQILGHVTSSSLVLCNA